MAGVKVTDLPVLGTAAADDVLYIVDTSSNTSSQIEVASLLPVVESGTWTPVTSAINNAVAGIDIILALYTRVGNVVTCSVHGTVDFIFNLFNDGEFAISLPIATSASNAIGTASVKQPNQVNGYVIGIGTGSTATFKFLSFDTSFVSNDNQFSSVFQYEIN